MILTENLTAEQYREAAHCERKRALELEIALKEKTDECEALKTRLIASANYGLDATARAERAEAQLSEPL